MAPTDRAIVVGISHYPDRAFECLEGPEADAKDFVQWLTSPEGGAVPPHHVECIVSSDFTPPAQVASAGKPTTERIHLAIDNLLDAGNGRYPIGRRLYLYFAGHGVAPQTLGGSDLYDAALLMANAAAGRFHAVPGREYADFFRRAALFDEVVLIMDCCRALSARAPVYTIPYTAPAASSVSRFFYAFSSEWRKSAFEGPWGPRQETRGLFTTVLLEGLRGAALPSSKSGQVDGRALADYLRQGVRDRAARAGIVQVPQIDLDDAFPIVFGTGGAAAGVIRFVAGPTTPSRVTLFDGALQPLTARVNGPDHWEWDVGIGIYRLDTDGQREFIEVTTTQRSVDRRG